MWLGFYYDEQAGTIGLEIFEQVKDVDVVVVPVGGAGLIAGVAMAIKTLKPDVTVIGVQPELCSSFDAALKAGKPVNAFKSASLADGLSVPMVCALRFPNPSMPWAVEAQLLY